MMRDTTAPTRRAIIWTPGRRWKTWLTQACVDQLVCPTLTDVKLKKCTLMRESTNPLFYKTKVTPTSRRRTCGTFATFMVLRFRRTQRLDRVIDRGSSQDLSHQASPKS